ncbi:glucosaminidase domain-containing protein [Pseudanabaena sp. FACHB-1998]|uniref:glucosaminidase domain-containing protein n=1 Tax=Pseudanabaena sp. FACHB-1998 TaxID=2692858 RepID=UPI0016817957|nr:glucosaminidase domain-containing protein [Pseudanabaena sp. FACHB-1998]MBD2178469.1 glucosaminidase domain-containing protein [Pseudanabaena sp. FACHB-1998]
MRRKQFLQIGSGAIALIAFDRICQDAAHAQNFVTDPQVVRQNQPCSPILTGKIDRIMGDGMTSEVQLLRLLRLNNAPLNIYGDLPTIYREEATTEGVNYDIAFCQMCLETGFLQFDGDVKPEQNNFGGIGAIGNGVRGDSFSDRRIGVRAQIQHLKAYATRQPLVLPLVDPRFSLVKRGTAPLLSQLSGNWAEDINYDKKIMAILRRLYELSGFF